MSGGKRPTVGAALAHIDLVVAQDDLGIDHLSTAGTYAARKLMEHVVGIFPRTACDRTIDFTGVKSSHGIPLAARPSVDRHFSPHTAQSRTGDSNVVRRQ